MAQQKETTFKMVIVGAEAVGKTTLLNTQRGVKFDPKLG